MGRAYLKLSKTMAKILVACEESQAITIRLRDLGHEAFSCDILPCSGGHPEWHLQGDVFNYVNNGWDLMIAHPPCTHLAVSGAAWFKNKVKEQAEALDFVRLLLDSDIPKICLENPVSVISSKIRKPDQILQPYQFGHMEQKKTCLWLKGLPVLTDTNNVREAMMLLPKNQRERIHYLPPSADRWKLRSKTFAGIAEAMATQWG